MSLRSMCRSTITLKRVTTAKDAAGGQAQTYTAVSGYSGIRCDIQPASSAIREQYREMQLAGTFSIYFAQDVPARAGDQLTGSDGTVYQFRGVRPPAPGYQQWACVVDVERQYG